MSCPELFTPSEAPFATSGQQLWTIRSESGKAPFPVITIQFCPEAVEIIELPVAVWGRSTVVDKRNEDKRNEMTRSISSLVTCDHS